MRTYSMVVWNPSDYPQTKDLIPYISYMIPPRTWTPVYVLFTTDDSIAAEGRGTPIQNATMASLYPPCVCHIAAIL